MLSKTYRNRIFSAIRDAGFDPGEFTISIDQNEPRTTLVSFRDGNVRFAIRTAAASVHAFDCRWTLGPKLRLTPWTPAAACSTFETIEAHLGAWLNSAVSTFSREEREESAPDLWAQLDAAIGGTDTDNTAFSPEERLYLADRLRRFGGEVRERQLLPSAQNNVLLERIEYLIRASNRLGRKDWIVAAIGVLAGFALQSELASNVARQLLQSIGAAVHLLSSARLLGAEGSSPSAAVDSKAGRVSMGRIRERSHPFVVSVGPEQVLGISIECVALPIPIGDVRSLHMHPYGPESVRLFPLRRTSLQHSDLLDDDIALSQQGAT